MFSKLFLPNIQRPSVWGVRAMAAIRLSCAFLAVLGSLLLSMQVVAATSPSSVGKQNTSRLPSCSWDQPGHNPFMGDVVAAVDRYRDIPIDVRARLKQRMAQRDYDDIVSIRRDSLEGKHGYDPIIRDMHFGVDRVCTQVSRQKWSAEQQERGLVYCEGSQCILVPTVCRNVSRITRLEPVAAAAASPPGGELLFDAPGAGQILGNAPSVPDPATFALLSSPATLSDGGAAVVPQTESGDPVAKVPVRDTDTKPSLFTPSVGVFPVSPGSPVVPISAVPEPGTWVLMILGLAACSAQAVRRRARSA